MSLADIATATASAYTVQQVVQACLLGWAGLELLLWLRNRGGNTAPDLTFGLVVASVGVGINLAFRAAHDPTAATGGGLALTAAGLVVLVLGVVLRTWAILALGRSSSSWSSSRMSITWLTQVRTA